MFNRILVAVDSFEASGHVFETALFQAKATNARLLLMHVLPAKDCAKIRRFSHHDVHPTTHSEDQFHSDECQDEEVRSWNILRSFQATATHAGIMADLALPRGEPGRVIHDEAHKWGAELIVLGRQGMQGLNELMLDSISHCVAYHTPYSILVVYPQAAPSSDTPQNMQQQVEMHY